MCEVGAEEINKKRKRERLLGQLIKKEKGKSTGWTILRALRTNLFHSLTIPSNEMPHRITGSGDTVDCNKRKTTSDLTRSVRLFLITEG
jgi:hypothetical protein